jgi:hypothetical protein
MKCKSLVAIVLLAGAGPALAQQRIAPVQVSAKPAYAVEVSCQNAAAPRRADVEKLLSINDSSQTHGLSNKLMAAVGEACTAGVASIEVRRGAQGRSLTWAPARESLPSIALN